MAIDPNIKQKANDIRTKLYGKDVRESLASGLEDMSEDVVNVTARQRSVEAQFKNVIEGTTGKDVISAPEIIAARMGHGSLREKNVSQDVRINQSMTQTEFDSWVATLLDGGPSIFYDTLAALKVDYPNGASGVALVRETDPAKIYVWDGNNWTDYGDYQGAEPKNGSITVPKLNRDVMDYFTVDWDYDLVFQDFDDSATPSSSKNTSTYIIDRPMTDMGTIKKITIHSLGNSADIKIFKKTGAATFQVISSTRIATTVGLNTIDVHIDVPEKGLYIGFFAYLRFGNYTQNPPDSAYYFHELTNSNPETGIHTFTKHDFKVKFAFEATGDHLPEVSKKVREEIERLESLLPGHESTVQLTDFGLPRYSEMSESIGYVGRWFDKTIGGVACKVTINQGSEFYFKVKDTAHVAVNFKPIHAKETPYFAYSIDGGPMIRQLITSPDLPELTNDEHIIRVIIDGITESENKWSGEAGVAFNEVVIDEGGTLTGVLPKNRCILFLGDSITEGIRVLNMNANANGNSASGAFPFFASQYLNAISYRVGFGATGVTKSGSGGVPKLREVIDHMTASRETPYIEPDLIVINQGHNDHGVSSNIFKEEYNRSLERLKLKYPGVLLFTMIPFSQRFASEIRECVAGKSYCYLIETEDWELSYTDGVHPDVNGSLVAGDRLAAEIQTILGKMYFYG